VINSLAPGFVKLYYTVGTKEHVQTIPVLPFPAGGGAWLTATRFAPGGVSWTTNMDGYITAIKPMFSALSTFTYAELWTQADADADPVYQTTYSINVVGTGGGTAVANGMVTISGRTENGGIAKLVLLESLSAVNQKLKPTYVAPYLAVVTYLLSTSCFLVGRNGGYWVNVPQITTKTNYTLRRQAGLE
jgi:hypothetical protein